MIQASLYILFCSARNRLRLRFRRLREPRYLLGAIVGVAYFYFVFFARMRSQSSAMRGRRGTNLPLATFATAGATLSGLALMVAMAAAWIVPFDNVLLQFSPAEIQFLFPAPVSRRSLLIHRLLRSQVRSLFGAAIFGIAVPSLGGGYARLRTGIGIWLVMGTLRMYFTGVSLARTSLRSTDRHARRVAWLSIGVIAFAWAVVGAALGRAFAASPIAGPADLWNRIALVATTGASRIVMAPFMAVAWPIFAAWPQPYRLAVLASAAVLAACIVWVILSDGALQVSTDAVTANLSPAIAPTRSASAAGSSSTSQRVASPAYRAAATGAAWHLAPTGRTESIFVWKAATHTFRSLDRRMVLRLAIVLAMVTVGAATNSGRAGLPPVWGALGGFAIIGLLFAVFMAPQTIRLDLRQDLQYLDLLKTWPVGAPAVVRGELIWPTLLITAIAWSLIALGAVFSATMFPEVGVGARLAIVCAAAVLAPALVLAQLAIHSAAALIFPAWVQLGNQRARGVDAMGQRIITLGGTWLVLIVMTLPGALAGAVIWFAFRGWLGVSVFVPAALIGAAILTVEAVVATEALGSLYERLDILAVERAE